MQGQIEEGRVAQADDNRDLKLVEKNLGSLAAALVRFGEEQHHRDGGAVETEQYPPGRGGHESDVQDGAYGHEHRGNYQEKKVDGKQKPEQGGSTAGAAKCNPGAAESEKIMETQD